MADDAYGENEAVLAVVSSRMPSVIVTGPLGCGADAFAAQLAARYGFVHVKPLALLERAIARAKYFARVGERKRRKQRRKSGANSEAANSGAGADADAVEDDKLDSRVLRALNAGEAVSDELMCVLIRRALLSDEVAFRGYVMGDFPRSAEHLDMLRSWGVFPTFIITLALPRSNELRRLLSVRVDPHTGHVFSGDELNPPAPIGPARKTRKQRRDADIAATFRPTDEARLAAELDPVSDDGDASREDDETGSYSALAESRQQSTSARSDDDSTGDAMTLTRRVRARLICEPLNMRDNVLARLEAYDTGLALAVSRTAAAYAAEHPDRVFAIDAMQSPEDMLRHATTVFDTVPVSPVVEAQMLAVPDNIENLSEDQALEYCLTADLPDDAPSRTLSRWRLFCPVTMYALKSMTRGSFAFPVAYRNCLYLTVSAAAQRRFVKNPHRFLAAPLEVSGLRIAVLGPPMSGKTTQAARLARQYGLPCLHVEALLDAAVRTDSPLGAELRRVLQDGTPVLPALYARLIGQELQLPVPPHLDPELIAAKAAKKKARLAKRKAAAAAARRRRRGRQGAPGSDAAGIGDEGDDKAGDAGDDEAGGADDDDDDEENGGDDDENGGYDDDENGGDDDENGGDDDDENGGDDVDNGEFGESRSTGKRKEAGDEGAESDRDPPGDATSYESGYADEDDADDEADGDAEPEPSLSDGDELASPTALAATGAAAAGTTAASGKTPNERGWVLDGFPLTREQLNALVEWGIVPTHVVVLSVGDEHDESALLERATRMRTDTLTGRPVLAEPAASAPAPAPVPASVPVAALALAPAPAPARAALVANEAPFNYAAAPRALPASRPPSARLGALPRVLEIRDLDTALASFAVTFEDLSDALGALGETHELAVESVPCLADADTVTGSILQAVDPLVVVPRPAALEEFISEYVPEPEARPPPSLLALASGGDQADVESEPAPSEHVAYGDTAHFCPVALAKKNCLRAGDRNLALEYGGRVYLCEDEAAASMFAAHPTLYLPLTRRPAIPPPRIMLLGAPGTGKSTVAATIAESAGLVAVHFEQAFRALALRADSETGRRLAAHLAPPAESSDAGASRDEGDGYDDSGYGYDDDANEGGAAKPAKPTSSISNNNNSNNNNNNNNNSSSRQTAEPLARASTATPATGALDVSVSRILGFDTIDANAAVAATLSLQTVFAEPLPDGLLAAAFREILGTPECTARGFVLDGLPDSEAVMEAFLALPYTPDLVLLLTMTSAEAIKRRFVAPDIPLEPPAPVRTDESGGGDGDGDGDGDGSALPDDPDERAAALEQWLEAREADIAAAREDFVAQHEAAGEAAAGLAAMAQDMRVPLVELDTSRRAASVTASLRRVLKPVLETRGSLLESAKPLTRTAAAAALAFGRLSLSKFGQYCPVALRDAHSLHLLTRLFPVQHRHYVYYLSSHAAQTAFLADPVRYVSQPPPPLMLPTAWARPRIALVGPPLSGKSTLARRLADALGIVPLTMADVLERVLLLRADGAREIEAVLRSGARLSDAQCVAALALVLGTTDVETSGWVLDGYPQTEAQLRLMEDAGVVPSLVFAVHLDDASVLERARVARASPARRVPNYDSDAAVRARLSVYRQYGARIEAWYGDRYLSLTVLAGDESKWSLWDQLRAAVVRNVSRRQAFLYAMKTGQAAPAGGLNFTDFDSCPGAFGDYCAVSLADDGELVDMGKGPAAAQFIAKYRGAYYKCADAERLERFVAAPERYVACALPAHLPRALSGSEGATVPASELQLGGFCPVSYADGPQGLAYLEARFARAPETLVRGRRDCMVAYAGRFYTFASEAARARFMRTPERFVGQTLPAKLPADTLGLDWKALPIRGYLAQHVAELVSAALVEVGARRPVYPGLDAHRSALVFVALLLKAANPSASPHVRAKYGGRVQAFLDAMRLSQYFAQNNPSVPGARLVPAERVAELDAMLARPVQSLMQ